MVGQRVEAKKENHQYYLDFDTVQEVPEAYSWTTTTTDNHEPDGDHPATDGFTSEKSIPVIDLNEPNAVELIGEACTTWGAFQVTNHGVPSSLLDSAECVAGSLFSLPLHQKLKTARLPGGVSGYGSARISAFFSKLMWSEGFTIFGSPLEHARLLWPDSGCTQFCEIMEEYQAEMEKLAARLLRLVLGSLGAGITAIEDVEWAGEENGGKFEGPRAAVQLNSYPACPDPSRAMGMAPHTDSTLLTILHQSSTSGLQVFRKGSGWVTVPPIREALVVNAGDLLQVITNGLCPSVLHRVMVNRSKRRLSIAYIYGPPAGVEISPLPKLVDPTRPALYRPVTWKEYLAIKREHFNATLSRIRLPAPDPAPAPNATPD